MTAQLPPRAVMQRKLAEEDAALARSAPWLSIHQEAVQQLYTALACCSAPEIRDAAARGSAAALLHIQRTCLLRYGGGDHQAASDGAGGQPLPGSPVLCRQVCFFVWCCFWCYICSCKFLCILYTCRFISIHALQRSVPKCVHSCTHK